MTARQREIVTQLTATSLFIALMAVFCLWGLTGCSVIGPGQRGIRYFFGKTSDHVEEPGAYIWIPFFMGMSKIDVQVQKSEVRTSAASKDMQEITTDLAINWKLSPDRVVATYRNVGDEEAILQRIIYPAVSEVLKAATAQHTAEDILKKRMELKAAIDEGLKARLGAYGIDLFDVSITHLQFTTGFEKAIEDKQIAEQRAKQASYEAEKATQDAKAEVERAKGQATAQNLIRASITREILQQRAIEKWDGHFPQVMGTGSTPFINFKMDQK